MNNAGANGPRARVSVVIPALNEEESIGGVVLEILATAMSLEIIVVDNGSTDRTADRAHDAGARVISEPRRGYGRACRAGVEGVCPDCEVIVFLDGDGSDCPEFINSLVKPVAEGQYRFRDRIAHARPAGTGQHELPAGGRWLSGGMADSPDLWREVY